MQNAISFLQLSTCCWCCPARLQPKNKTYETRVERSWSNVEAMLRVQECIHPTWLPQIRLVSLRFVDELCAVPNHSLHAWPHCENLSLDVSFVCYYVVFRCFVLIESSLSRATLPKAREMEGRHLWAPSREGSKPNLTAWNKKSSFLVFITALLSLSWWIPASSP